MSSEIAEQARTLLAHMQADIANAATRTEWMRLTQLASEAERLVATIDRQVSNG